MRYKASALSLSPRHAGLDHLELLERLPAARAVANRAAGRWPEEVVEAGVLRAAVGTAVDGRLDPKQRHRAGLPRRGRGEARLAQLAPPLFRDAIGGPALGRDFDLGLCPEPADRLDHLPVHHLDGRATKESRCEFDPNPVAVDSDGAHD